MLIEEIVGTDEIGELLDEGVAWGRRGNAIVRKYRCSGGPRKGKVVSTAAQCFAPPDPKKKLSLSKTKAKYGKRLNRKAKKTKRLNVASKQAKRLNKK